MNAKTVDLLIFIPLIFDLPPLGFLPWGRWTPKKIGGPYLIYCAFAIWRFKQLWWVVLMSGFMGAALPTAVIFDVRKARMTKQAGERQAKTLKQARNWPVAEGFVF